MPSRTFCSRARRKIQKREKRGGGVTSNGNVFIGLQNKMKAANKRKQLAETQKSGDDKLTAPAIFGRYRFRVAAIFGRYRFRVAVGIGSGWSFNDPFLII